MSGINVSTSASELISSTTAAGSVSSSGHNVVTSNVQSAAAVSTAIGSTRSTSEAKKKQLQDGNRITAGGRNAASSSTIPPLSTAVVRQLIEESHLDLVNLLTSHLTTVLNPIVADTNAKYEHLDKRFDSLVGLDDNEGHNLNQVQNEMGHESIDITP
ncbi:hypothetical protein PIB30_053636 [Stylosanthes scabra]|uniref:Uncharacterized protein n=1 Tax=Stylosanthes scabra TaxID=79078 RepID=A0ABU6WGQ2_9FABA|nr:hypothetical protein [Stylosanthes scabra]